MSKESFEQEVLRLLGQVLEKQNEHDLRFKEIDKQFKGINDRLETIEYKLEDHDNQFKTIIEQTARNAELEYTVNNANEKADKALFEVELLKKYIRS